MKLPALTALTVCALSGCGSSAATNPTLCELAPHREDFAGQEVTVEGVLLVSRHSTIVVEPKCDMGIGIEWSENDASRMPEFHAIAERSEMETLMAKVSVTGVLKQKTKPDWVGGRPWYLDLTDAKVLEAYPIADADEERFLRWRSEPSPEPFKPSR